ncbi:MAG: hypothetical protein QM734_00115 [Cyclobacteriaceae bacterium]
MKQKIIKTLAILVAVFLYCEADSKDPYPKNESIDIRHYDFHLEVNDSTDIIYGEAFISIVFKKSISFF